MSNFTASKRNKNNIVHVFDGEKTHKTWYNGEVEVSVCGSCDTRSTGVKSYDVEREDVLDNEYLVVNGNIIGKFCGNCSSALTSDKFS